MKIAVYDLNLVDKTGFERTDPHFDKSSTVGKMLYQTALDAAEKLFMKGRDSEANFISVSFYEMTQSPQPSAITILVTSTHQNQGKTLHQQDDYDSPKTQMMVSIF